MGDEAGVFEALLEGVQVHCSLLSSARRNVFVSGGDPQGV